MKVKHIFPFLSEGCHSTGNFFQVNHINFADYLQNASQFENFYWGMNVTEDYFLSKGETGSVYSDNQHLTVPVIELDDYGVISPKSIPAVFELVLHIYPYMAEKIAEETAVRKSVGSLIELTLQRLKGIHAYVKVPMLTIEGRHEVHFEHFLKLALKKELRDFNKVQNALLYWRLSYEREDYIDSILDLAISIESIFNVSDEQSLKIPIFVYHFLDTNKHSSLMSIYKLYQFRNRIIHGNDLPEINASQRMEIINVVAAVLNRVLLDGKLPDTKALEKDIYLLYHNEH